LFARSNMHLKQALWPATMFESNNVERMALRTNGGSSELQRLTGLGRVGWGLFNAI
jgi:hypothetical protein